MPRFLSAVVLVVLFPGSSVGRAAAPEVERFSFVAIGCMPYGKENYEAYDRLLKEINRHEPAFTVHCGDTKAGDEPPTEEFLMRMKKGFISLKSALIYTPGDNEWTDVWRPEQGGHDPAVWLAKVRATYFTEERSLGRKPIALVTQRQDPTFSQFVENARWSRGGVVFATTHVVGSNNNCNPARPSAMGEFRERDLANAGWVRAAFAEARGTNAAGVALFFQAEPFASLTRTDGRESGFTRFLETIEDEARMFEKPVLLVHADEHRYRLERGMRFRRGGELLANVTRLETFGANDIHGVLVVVDPASTQVFLPGPLIVPGNRLPGLPKPAAPKKK